LESVVIVDYKAGNLTSVELAVLSVGGKPVVTGDPERVRKAARVIFPGVGAAPAAMEILEREGLAEALKEVYAAGKPILGICLGAQIVLSESEEGAVPCLNLLPGRTVRLNARAVDGAPLKIPHMGWNAVEFVQEHPVVEGIPVGAEFYFVHSYFPSPGEDSAILGRTEYGRPFTSALAVKNLVAVQFHPEKSGRWGLKFLENFLAWKGDGRAQ